MSHGIVGFGKATEIATEEDVKQMTVLRNRLIDNILKQIPDTMLNGSKETDCATMPTFHLSI